MEIVGGSQPDTLIEVLPKIPESKCKKVASIIVDVAGGIDRSDDVAYHQALVFYSVQGDRLGVPDRFHIQRPADKVSTGYLNQTQCGLLIWRMRSLGELSPPNNYESEPF